MTDRLRAVFLLGPTASGKTDLALRLCERCHGEIVSVDSVQIYRGMDIGSAKPSPEILRRFPHHLINILEPCETYSVAQFCQAAHDLVKAINARGALPILTGGTMFYFHAFEHGLDLLPPGDPETRRDIEEWTAREGIRALHKHLASVDPEMARRLEPNDVQRVQRAWEVYLLTSKPISEILKDAETMRITSASMRLCKLAFDWSDRLVLHRRIEKRFDQMLRDGLQDEVCQLMLRGDMTPALPAVRAVGYRQMWHYLCGEVTREFMREKSVTESRRLAKRQCTWMRSMKGLHRLMADEMSPDAMEKEALRRILPLCE